MYVRTYICFISAWLPKNNNNAMFSMVYVVFLGTTRRLSLQGKGGYVGLSIRVQTRLLIYSSALLYRYECACQKGGGR